MMAQTREDIAFRATMSLRITAVAPAKAMLLVVATAWKSETLWGLWPSPLARGLVGFCLQRVQEELEAENFRTWSSQSSFNRAGKVSYIEQRKAAVPPIVDWPAWLVQRLPKLLACPNGFSSSGRNVVLT